MHVLPKIVLPAAVLTLAMGVTACGAHARDDKPATAQPAPTEEAPVAAAPAAEASMPAMLIARVPVDASGKELMDKYETSITAEKPEALSEGNVEATFTAGDKIAVADELDQNSSADQWYRPFSLINQIGRAVFGPSPRFFYATGGYNYYYNPYRSYNYGGYNYYSYGYGGYGNCGAGGYGGCGGYGVPY